MKRRAIKNIRIKGVPRLKILYGLRWCQLANVPLFFCMSLCNRKIIYKDYEVPFQFFLKDL